MFPFDDVIMLSVARSYAKTHAYKRIPATGLEWLLFLYYNVLPKSPNLKDRGWHSGSNMCRIIINTGEVITAGTCVYERQWSDEF